MSDTVAPQEGKFYRTRGGERLGPANTAYHGRFEFSGPHTHCHDPDGHYLGWDRDLDLVAEWTEGPVVTETVKRIAEGRYGIVQVDVHRDQVVVTIDAEQGHNPTASQLREAAATLSALADAL